MMSAIWPRKVGHCFPSTRRMLTTEYTVCIVLRLVQWRGGGAWQLANSTLTIPPPPLLGKNAIDSDFESILS